MSTGPEFAYVGQAFIGQLIEMGSKLMMENLGFPSSMRRSSFHDVVIPADLTRTFLKRTFLKDLMTVWAWMCPHRGIGR
jgi:hypothetical protein